MADERITMGSAQPLYGQPPQATPTYEPDADYILTQRTVHAMQYDGSMANAYEILGRAHRHNSTGKLVKNESSFREDEMLLRVGPGDTPVQITDWVVFEGSKQISVMNDADFRDKYTPAPQYGVR